MARDPRVVHSPARQKATVGAETGANEDTAMTLQHHLEDCYEVRLETNKALDDLKKQLEPWTRVAIFLDKLTTFLTKYGLRLLWTVVTGALAAYAGIQVQLWNASHSAEAAAQASKTAAVAASTAVTTQATATQKLSRKLDVIQQQTNAAGP